MHLTRSMTHPSGASFPTAYEWIGRLTIDFEAGTGQVILNLHPDATSAGAGKPPIDRLAYRTGQAEADPANPGAVVTFPPLAQVYTDCAAHFDAIRAYLYTRLAAMPSQAGATLGTDP